MKTITTELMKIAVNCYLVQTGAGFFLVDTGMAKKQACLDHELEQSGCRPGDLKLIILTHGDSDHSGNSAHLRERYGAKIAIHRGDLESIRCATGETRHGRVRDRPRSVGHVEGNRTSSLACGEPPGAA